MNWTSQPQSLPSLSSHTTGPWLDKTQAHSGYVDSLSGCVGTPLFPLCTPWRYSLSHVEDVLSTLTTVVHYCNSWVSMENKFCASRKNETGGEVGGLTERHDSFWALLQKGLDCPQVGPFAEVGVNKQSYGLLGPPLLPMKLFFSLYALWLAETPHELFNECVS